MTPRGPYSIELTEPLGWRVIGPTTVDGWYPSGAHAQRDADALNAAWREGIAAAVQEAKRRCDCVSHRGGFCGMFLLATRLESMSRHAAGRA